MTDKSNKDVMGKGISNGDSKQDRGVIVSLGFSSKVMRIVVLIGTFLLLGWFAYSGYEAYNMGEEVTVGTVLQQLKEEKVEEIEIREDLVKVTLKDNQGKQYAFLEPNTSFTELAQKAEVNLEPIKVKPVVRVPWIEIATFLITLVMIYGIFKFLQNMQKSGGSFLSFGKSKAGVIVGKRPEVGFKDVAGLDETKLEVSEIVDFLQNPKRFFNMGARIPRGVLLFGRPGTGKTLLARAVAGEAKVPFFHTSGPEFEEMLVGAGAARVRDLFKRAKNVSPSIIFIDEIDAVARKRGTDVRSATTEQTLNQILVEMDGFSKRSTVIVIGATNRPDVLDPALIRPGRFDRTIVLPMPDAKERESILELHGSNKKFAKEVNLEQIAKQTIDFTGADLENLLNEAAILTVREKKEEIGQDEINEAYLKVLYGPERKSRIRQKEDLEKTAYHEAGHAIAAHYTPKADPVDKVTIISRGMSLGLTMLVPSKERENYTYQEILAQITTSTAGRVAEELVYGLDDITTGAAADIKSVTKLAQDMVKQYGMSKKVGFVKYGQGDEERYLGYAYSGQTVSPDTAAKIDEEVRAIVDKGFKKAKEILTKQKTLMDKVAEALLKKETLNKKEFAALVKNWGK